MTNKERLFNAFDNQPVDRVPVGFWFHFLPNEVIDDALEKPELAAKSIAGHRAFIEGFRPDFVKIMSDGYFHYPMGKREDYQAVSDLTDTPVCGGEHPWVKAQVELARTVVAMQKDTAYFYNIFSPACNLQWFLGAEAFYSYLLHEPAAVEKALANISQGLLVLARQVIEAGGADGVYYSVSNPDPARISDEQYLKHIAPGERSFLYEIEKIAANNILHICGFEGKRNNLALYADYPGKAINWAVTTEKVSLAEGKRLFGGRAVSGGFANTAGSLLHAGPAEEIAAYARQLVAEAGSTGVIIGADCTLPSDTPIAHLEAARQGVRFLG
jgi:uroporphyrinogen decarboxylase